MTKRSAHEYKVREWEESKFTRSENTKNNHIHIALMSNGRIFIKKTYKLKLFNKWTSESTGWKLAKKCNKLEKIEQKLIQLGYEKI